jgi:hypothetical protein
MHEEPPGKLTAILQSGDDFRNGFSAVETAGAEAFPPSEEKRSFF